MSIHDPPLELHLPPDLAVVRSARTQARDLAKTVMGDVDRIHDVELATSELVTNAIMYGGNEPFSVTMHTHDDRFTIHVRSTLEEESRRAFCCFKKRAPQLLAQFHHQ